MNLSQMFLVIAGVILVGFGVYFAVQAMQSLSWVQGVFALFGIVVGAALILKRDITLG